MLSGCRQKTRASACALIIPLRPTLWTCVDRLSWLSRGKQESRSLSNFPGSAWGGTLCVCRLQAPAMDRFRILRFSTFRFALRESRCPEVGVRAPSLVIVDPNAPTLEQLWEGGVEIEVHGPRGQHVKCSVSLFGKGDTVPHLKRTLPGLTIPVSPSNWSAFIEKRMKDDHKIQNAYDLAHRCEVHLRAGEFGAFTLVAEREFAPFRWAVSRKQHAFHIRAIDDTGGQAATEVRLYDFGTPDAGRLLDPAPFRIGAGAKARSGLYAAHAGDHHRAVVIPPEVHTFADLRLEPRLLARRRTPSDIVALVRCYIFGRAHG